MLTKTPPSSKNRLYDGESAELNDTDSMGTFVMLLLTNLFLLSVCLFVCLDTLHQISLMVRCSRSVD
jgi:hypothetical protein